MTSEMSISRSHATTVNEKLAPKVKNGVHYKHDNLLMDGSRSMEFSLC